jgi:hypothetical protein
MDSPIFRFCWGMVVRAGTLWANAFLASLSASSCVVIVGVAVGVLVGADAVVPSVVNLVGRSVFGGWNFWEYLPILFYLNWEVQAQVLERD